MKLNTVDAWHQLLKTRNTDDLDLLLSDKVVFHSPVTHTPQAGKIITSVYLTVALSVFVNESFNYVRQIISDNDAALEFEVEIDGILVNGVDMIKWDDEGKIIDFKVSIRPLKAVNLIHKKMGELLQVAG
ncbi:nuclear transport factor 2 family protein [Moritella sp. 24]|uniref:nuclear transport factor 2 family protein n=1 Tax=Moritella sp. 24 TaxID=2746230 RepID=UPI001BA9B49B|nr:nuclear transport factor 2 family protein [Moritella sp. 24]QUM76726.1 nuclear transport factor 2 family protein [Moritella sp. 24]